MEAYAHRQLQQRQSRASSRTPLVMRRRASGVAAITLTAVKAPAKGKSAATPAAAPKPSVGAVIKKASATAFRGGVAGFMAGVVQARRTHPHAFPPTPTQRRSGARQRPRRACRHARAVGWPGVPAWAAGAQAALFAVAPRGSESQPTRARACWAPPPELQLTGLHLPRLQVGSFMWMRTVMNYQVRQLAASLAGAASRQPGPPPLWRGRSVAWSFAWRVQPPRGRAPSDCYALALSM